MHIPHGQKITGGVTEGLRRVDRSGSQRQGSGEEEGETDGFAEQVAEDLEVHFNTPFASSLPGPG